MLDAFEEDKSKLAYFGQWLTEQTRLREVSVFSCCANPARSIDVIRLEYGKMETYKYILQAFVHLYEKDISEFRKEYLDLKDNESDDRDPKQPST